MKKNIYIILSVFFLVILDFLSKYFFSGLFQEVFSLEVKNIHQYFPVIWDFFGIQLHYNTGVAFGIPITGIPLKTITIMILGVLLYYFIRYEISKNNKLLDISFIFIISGAIAHAIERIVIWKVVDFLSLKYFAIFNFADIYITIGGILFIYYTIKYEWKRKSNP